MSNKQWETAATVAVPKKRYGDELIWWKYSLFLLCNRHVADCIDDDEVSVALNNMAAKIPLPYD
ncbi:MAG: hypothetical protein ACRECV_02080 [Xanthobacteraceae bacterium]